MKRFTVAREDFGKADIFDGKRDRKFYILDNQTGQAVGDDTGETYYYDLYEDALEYCNELNED